MVAATYRVLNECQCRNEHRHDSDKAGTLKPGINFEAISTVVTDGKARVQSPDGWVNVQSTKTGTIFLEPTNLQAWMAVHELEPLEAQLEELGVDDIEDFPIVPIEEFTALGDRLDHNQRQRFRSALTSMGIQDASSAVVSPRPAEPVEPVKKKKKKARKSSFACCGSSPAPRKTPTKPRPSSSGHGTAVKSPRYSERGDTRSPSTSSAEKKEAFVSVILERNSDVDQAFSKIDINRNGALSFAEVRKAVTIVFPSYKNMAALMLACDTVENSGNGFFNKQEFRTVVETLVHIDAMWSTFEAIQMKYANGESESSSRIDLSVFRASLAMCELDVVSSDSARLFESIKLDDDDRGGQTSLQEIFKCVVRLQLDLLAEPQPSPPVSMKPAHTPNVRSPKPKQTKPTTPSSDLSLSSSSNTCVSSRKKENSKPPRSSSIQQKTPPRSSSFTQRTPSGSSSMRKTPPRSSSKHQAISKTSSLSATPVPLKTTARQVTSGMVELMMTKFSAAVPSKAKALEALKKADASGNGELDANELAMVFRDVGINLSEKQVLAFSKALDDDGDGSVQIGEFLTKFFNGRLGILRNKLRAASYMPDGTEDWEKLFHSLDRDNDRCLTMTEFKRAVLSISKVKSQDLPESEIREMFLAFKTHPTINGDDVISIEEFLDFMAVQEEAKLPKGVTDVFTIIHMHLEEHRLNPSKLFRTWSSESSEMTLSQFRQGLATLGTKLSANQAKTVFQALDESGEGTLSQEEYLGMVRKVKRTLSTRPTLRKEVTSFAASPRNFTSRKPTPFSPVAVVGSPRKSFPQGRNPKDIVNRIYELQQSRPTSKLYHDTMNSFFQLVPSKAKGLDLFKKADADCSGRLNFHELGMVFRDCGINLSESQVNALAQCLDQDGSGDIEIEEFMDLLFVGRIDIFRRKLRALSYNLGKEDWPYLFQTFDRHNAGKLQFDDFRRAVRKSCKVTESDMPDKELAELFSVIDLNDDRSIDPREWIQFLEGPGEMAEQAVPGLVFKVFEDIFKYLRDNGMNPVKIFSMWSGNGGELDPEEFRKGMRSIGIKDSEGYAYSRDDVAEVFQVLDTGGDGTISQEEFFTMLRHIKRLYAQHSSVERKTSVMLSIQAAAPAVRDPLAVSRPLSKLARDSIRSFSLACTSKAMALKVLKRINSDHSGTLTVRKLSMLYEHFGIEHTAAQALAVVTELSASRSSPECRISAFMQHHFKARVSEIRRKLRAPAMQDWKSLFSETDKNRSGELDFGELCACVRKYTKMTELQLPTSELRDIFAEMENLSIGNGDRDRRKTFNTASQYRSTVSTDTIDQPWAITIDQWENFLGVDAEVKADRLDITSTIFTAVYDYIAKTAQRPVDVFRKWSGDGFDLTVQEFSSAVNDRLKLGVDDEDIMHVFRELDTSADGSLSQEEFLVELRNVKRSRSTHRKMETRSVGTAVPKSKKLAVPKTPLSMPSKQNRDAAFSEQDSNKNGAISFVEVTKAVKSLFSGYENVALLMVAFKTVDRASNGYLNKRDFRLLLECMIFFESMWERFEELSNEAEIPGEFTPEEFTHAAANCGVIVSQTQVDSEFNGLSNGSATVTFENFCVWVALKHQATGMLTKNWTTMAPTSSGLLKDTMKQFCEKVSSKAQAHDIFVKADADGSGSLSMHELAMVMRDFGVNLSEKQAQQLAADLDTDGTGAVEVQELLDLLFIGRIEMMKKRLMAKSYHDGKADSLFLFRMFDKDNDGKLIFREFLSALRKSCRVTVSECPDTELRDMFTHITQGADAITPEMWKQFLMPSQSIDAGVVGDCFGKIYDYLARERQNPTALFQRWSTNGFDLTIQNFSDGLKSIDVTPRYSIDDLKVIFQALDTTGDKTISQEEYLAMIRTVKRARASDPRQQ